MKCCSKCHEVKSIKDFPKRNSKDGYDYWCYVCHNDYPNRKKASVNYHARNREKQRARNKVYYVKNREKIKKQTQQWRSENHDRMISYNKEYGKWWRANNKGLVTAAANKRSKRIKRATPPWFEEVEVKELYTKCATLTKITGVKHEVDHDVPIQSELVCGLHCRDNLRIIKASDNRKKWNKHEI